ncbi:DNA glycosylase AlkZ-like family protein [Actinoplanes friuliensis]|uniref:Winged helix-turn-helix domain-containing protein n=1 Tax=Actinoplanes friuliensis DSM 7358 TaxID=1246995 RepID=U5VUS5_9ACTN|nr:crosslink repair DNA glycosylase YcaQ family protein [Actinoplanes friuliensis]AGZ40594.1 hypothetical protein AFR_11525 [Actinoplanes friuliensis DSM 7358]
MALRKLDLDEARRIAVRAQLLDLPRPSDLLAVARQLTLLQIDPTAAVAPNVDLVLWSRLGSAYRPEQVKQALESDRTLFEHNAMVRPMSDLGLYLAAMTVWPYRESHKAWLAENDTFRRDILARLAASGPLVSRDIPDTSAVSWPSSGWTNNRNVTQMLEFMMMLGEVAITGRRGRQRVWDLAERVHPAGTPVVELAEAQRIREHRRLTSMGITRTTNRGTGMEPGAVGESGEEVTVEGTRGVWRVDPEAIGKPFTGRTALLSPFDRLIHDRVRLAELFGFEYVLEMYKPKAKRRWGFFALPILFHDRLIGKVDAKADHKAGVLRVDAIHEDVPFAAAMREGVEAELHDLATWLRLKIA